MTGEEGVLHLRTQAEVDMMQPFQRVTRWRTSPKHAQTTAGKKKTRAKRGPAQQLDAVVCSQFSGLEGG